jgi:hypothetical protein
VKKMDGVEGLMGKLKLTEAERGGVKIGGDGGRRTRLLDPQAVGKVNARWARCGVRSRE